MREVWVNGAAATLGQKITPGIDKVTVSGKPVRVVPQKRVTVVVHKPRGLVCSNDDPHHAATVFELLPKEFSKLRFFCAGRLDLEALRTAFQHAFIGGTQVVMVAFRQLGQTALHVIGLEHPAHLCHGQHKGRRRDDGLAFEHCDLLDG